MRKSQRRVVGEMRNMQVIQQGQLWVIAKNFRLLDMNGVSGSRSRSANRVREVYECWTGERWAHQQGAAKFFQTADEAQQFLDENWDRLAQA
jgi:hypothetical protein